MMMMNNICAETPVVVSLVKTLPFLMLFLNLPFFTYFNELIRHCTATLGDSSFFGKPQTSR